MTDAGGVRGGATPPSRPGRPGNVTYARGLFDLQLALAEVAGTLTGAPLERALLDHTNLFVRFGCGRTFDAAHPRWQAYLAGLHGAECKGDWTYRFYLRQAEERTAPPVAATVGCFSYAVLGPGELRLHFSNAERDGCSPLAPDRATQRRAELAALFDHARRTVGDTSTVIGMSWLYNLDAYRRLFPPAHVASARPIRGRFRSMTLWGQFVDRHGRVREAPARAFRARVATLSSPAGLDDCFPLQVLRVEAPIAVMPGVART